MAILKYIKKIKRIDLFIQSRATGTPNDFAKKLNMSKSALYKYLNLMKEMNAPIRYNNITESYYYEDNGSFEIGYRN